MYCTKCGKQIDDTARFCKFCGAAVDGNHGESRDTAATSTTEGTSAYRQESFYTSGTAKSASNQPKTTGGSLPVFILAGLFLLALVMIFLDLPQDRQEDPVIVSWEEAGLNDHVMDWQDEALEAAMQNITMIDGDIMLSDVWELTVLNLSPYMDTYSEWNVTIKNISALSELTNLTTLYLGGNEIDDICALRNLTKLTFLDLSENEIWDISPLRDLTNLTTLYLGANLITNVSELSGLTNLTILYLNDNQISDISSLGGYFRFSDRTRLERLFIKIPFIRQMQGLIHLTDLDLSYNTVSDVSALGKLTNLTFLRLGYNEICDITPLGKLTRLTVLILNDNQITDISVLQNLTNLISLYLVGNPLDGGTDILYELPMLTGLYLTEDDLTEAQMAEMQGNSFYGTGTWTQDSQDMWGEETEQELGEEQDQEEGREQKTKQEKKPVQEKSSKETDKNKDGRLNGDYVIADSNSRYLTSSELQKMSLKEINYAKNEIYARRGRKFQSKELQNYFNSKSWYKGTIEPDAFQWDTFNDYEKANAELLSKTEFERDPKGYLLDQ